MDREQMSKKLDWLDGQRKESSQEFQRLRAHVQDLENSIGTISKQVEDLSSENSRLAAAASKIAQFDEALAKHRNEISRNLKDAEERRTNKEKQIDSLRKSDQKNIIKTIDELRRDLKRLDVINEEMEQRRAEEVRMNGQLNELSERVNEAEARLDDRTLRLISLEEISAQDSKRANESRVDISVLKRATSDLQNTIDNIEDRTRKAEVNISDLKSMDSERSEQLEVWADDQRMRLVDFEKKWSMWGQRFDEFEIEAKNIEEKILVYNETHRSIKQMQEQLEELLERLERRITEVGEMQRLSEERIKQDWAAFEADETKKWSTFKLSSEERWKEHQRLHGKLSGTVENLEVLKNEMREDLNALHEREARMASGILALTRQWLKDME